MSNYNHNDDIIYDNGNDYDHDNDYNHDHDHNNTNNTNNISAITNINNINHKYERYSFPQTGQTSSPSDITQNWLNEQLERTLDNLTMVDMKLDSLNGNGYDNGHVNGNGNDNGNPCFDENGLSTEELLQFNHDDNNDVDVDVDYNNVNLKNDNIKSPEEMLESLEYLSLAHAYLSINDDDDDNDNDDNVDNAATATTDDHADDDDALLISSLSQLVKLQNKLAHILLNYLPPHKIMSNDSNNNNHNHSNNDNNKYTTLYNEIQSRYKRMNSHLQARSILELRNYIRNSNFPYSHPPNDNSLDSKLVHFVIETIIQSQIMNQSIRIHTSNVNVDISDNDTTLQQQQQQEQAENIIEPIIQEFMKPIVNRVQYHFSLSNNDDIHNHSPTISTPTSTSTSTIPIVASKTLIIKEEIQKKPEKLLGWVCTYIQDMIKETNMNHLFSNLQSILMSIMKKSMSTSMKNNNNNNNFTFSSIPNVHKSFMDELNTLIEFILYQHDYFPKLKSSQEHQQQKQQQYGSSSRSKTSIMKYNPIFVMCNVIETILDYDSFMMQLFMNNNAFDYYDDENYNDEKGEESISLFDFDGSITTLTDRLIVNDIGLFHWWLECERINALNTLKLNNNNEENNEGEEKKINNNNSNSNSNNNGGKHQKTIIRKMPFIPFAEAFLSLLISFQSKMSFLTDSEDKQIFIQKVEVPVCIAFMEGMHKKASILRKGLLQRSGGIVSGIGSSSNNIPNAIDLKSNIQKWIGVITGTKLASRVLHKNATIHNTSNSIHIHHKQGNDRHLERERIGNSLGRLAEAMVEELSSAFVEDLLLERTKFASYLMQCAHTISSDQIDPYHNFNLGEISPELGEVYNLLHILSTVCNDEKEDVYGSKLQYSDDDADDQLDADAGTDIGLVQQIPTDIIKNITARVEEKFLEVALDYNDMIPELSHIGCQIFSFDTNQIATLFHSKNHTNNLERPFSRLNDVAKLMSMDDAKFQALRTALSELLKDPLQHPMSNTEIFDSIVIERLEQDGTLLNEAQSMVFAQGFQFLNLYDTINVMNRRRVSHATLDVNIE